MRLKPHLLPRAMLLILVGLTAPGAMAQWTQWGGPRGDFTCDSKGLADRWPEDGPRKLWTGEIGLGHSAIVTDGTTLFTMCRRDDKDAVLAFDAATGKRVWETPYDAPTRPDMTLDMGCGPHSTPLLVGDRLYTVGAMVHFNCLDKRTGKILWSHNLVDEMGASCLMRGYGSSPTAYKDTVILNVGGKEVGIVAFKQDTGEIAWKSDKLPPGYPTPLLAQLDGQDQLVIAMSTERLGLDPATGKIIWRTSVDRQCASIMSTPVWIAPDKFFYSAAYGCGSQLFKISQKDGAYVAEELWKDTKLKVMHGNVVRIGDTIYGSSGDFGPAFLLAIRLDTGKIAWRSREFSQTTLLYADGKLIILDEEGNLALATVTPEKLEVHSKVKMLQEKSWTVPTLVGTTLYLRDEHTIMAVDLSAAGGKK